MYYEINVSDSRGHVFATAERSGQTDEASALELYRLIASKFPEKEGYQVSMVRWEVSGYPMAPEKH